MKLGMAIVLGVMAATFFIVSLPTLVMGPRLPAHTAADVQEDWSRRAHERDLSVDGVVVRNGGLADHRLDSAYYLPLVDAVTAGQVDLLGYWTAPTRGSEGRVVVVRLSLDRAQGSGLPWDERVTRPSGVGAWRVAGAVRPLSWFDGAEDLVWERLGLRADEVVLIDHGAPSFGRGNAAAGTLVGLVCFGLALRLSRRRRGPEVAQAARPGGYTRWGAVVAGCLGLLLLAGRLLDDVVRSADGLPRVLDSIAGKAAAALRGLDDATVEGRVLGAVGTARDLTDLAQALRWWTASDGQGFVTIRQGRESYLRRDGVWHLVDGSIVLELDGGRGESQAYQVPVSGRFGEGDGTRVTFSRADDEVVVARIERMVDSTPGGAIEPPDVFDVPVRFTVGDWEALVGGGIAELVCTDDGLKVLGAAHARDLRRLLVAAGASGDPDVSVERARTPRFLVRQFAMSVDAGELSFRVRTGATR